MIELWQIDSQIYIEFNSLGDHFKLKNEDIYSIRKFDSDLLATAESISPAGVPLSINLKLITFETLREIGEHLDNSAIISTANQLLENYKSVQEAKLLN